MKTKLNLVLALGLALTGAAVGCGDEAPSTVDGGGGIGGSGGGIPGTGGNKPGTGGTNPDGGPGDGGGGASANDFGAFVIDLIKNKTNETGAPASLEGRTFDMSEDVGTFVELLK